MRPVFSPRMPHPVPAKKTSRLWVFSFIHFVVGYFAYIEIPGLRYLVFVYLLVSLAYAAFGNKEQVLRVIFYSVGAEVFWRMTDLAVAYEFNKYLLILLFSIGLVRWKNIGKKHLIPVLYFMLLLPSILVNEDLTRQDLSFNLSGPTCLVFGMLFFSSVNFKREQVLKCLKAMIYPIISVSAICLFSTLSSTQILFTQSVLATSGGFGPNQVSSALGLGGLVAFYVFLSSRNLTERAVSLLLVFVFFTQVILTFSRGGFYTAFVSLLIFSYAQFKSGAFSKYLKYLPVILVLVLVSVSILDRITEKTYKDRFSDFDTTGRSELAKLELNAFFENPILGLGPGGGKQYRLNFDLALASHTEYTRLLGEHGILGGGCLLILATLIFRRILKKDAAMTKYLALSLVCWSFLYMFHAGMRLAAPAILFSLGIFGVASEPIVQSKNWQR